MESKLNRFYAKSASPSEFVLGYLDAIAFLNECESAAIKVLGWEGWIKRPDNTCGHSQEHQGTECLSSLGALEAINITRRTIAESYSQWRDKPEIEGAELQFCITVDGI